MHGKWIYLAQRSPRLSRQEFFERWIKHRKLGAPPAMGAEFVTADYCAVRAESVALEAQSNEYDGVGVFALNSLASIPLVAKFLKLDHIQADEKRFFTTTSESFSLFCGEEVIRDGHETPVVLLQFLRRHADLSPTIFVRRWREAHAAAILENPAFASLSRYIQNQVVAPPPPGYGYDGIAEWWFESVESLTSSVDALNRLWLDTDFIDHKNSFCVVTDIIASRPRKTG